MKPFDPALLRDLPATRGPVSLLAVIGTISGVAAIAQAVILAMVVTRVVTSEPWGGLLTTLVALVALRGVLAAAGEYVAQVAGVKVAGIVRLSVLRHWLSRPVEERPSQEEAVTRASEGVAAIEPYVGRYLPSLVTGAVVPLLAVVTLLWVDPWSALIVLLTLPLLPVFAILIGRHTADETDRRWAAMELLSGHFLDVVKGLPTLVGYGRAEAQTGVVREVGERHRRATGRTLRTAFMTTAALELLATISVALVAVAVGLRLAYGVMDLQVGLMAILLAPEAYWPLRRVGAEFHNAADGATTLERLRGSFGNSPTVASAPTATASGAPERIGLTEVSYAHPGRERTVTDVTLHTLDRPGLTALTGPSGAGKTTVLELLAGLRQPATGTVQAPSTHLASQRPVILPGTVRDNLLLSMGSGASQADEHRRAPQGAALRTIGPEGLQPEDSPIPGSRPHLTRQASADRQHDAALVSALERVGLWEALQARDGLETDLGDDGFGLSAGQLARLALARAILSDARLVLLDEPTANVAAASLASLHRIIEELARDLRVIVVTHDEDLAVLANERWRIEPAPLPAIGVDSALVAPESLPEPDAEGPPALRPGEVKPIQTPGGQRGLVLACVLGGLALAAGIALTATSGWLIVQASTQPVILTLLVAIVGVRAFGLARPVLRYAERVVSHDVALEDLAERRAQVYARLIPLTPARLGRRSRGQLLTALVRDLDDVVDEQIRVTVPGWSVLISSVIGAAIAAIHLPSAGLAVLGGTALACLVGVIAARAELAAQTQAVAHRGELQQRTTALADRLTAVQAVTGMLRLQRQEPASTHALLDPVQHAQEGQERAERRLITVRSLALAGIWASLALTAAVVMVLAWQAHAAGSLSGPYAALVALLPMALADVWGGIPDIAGAHARARAAAGRMEALLDQEPAVAATGTQPLPEPATTATGPHLRFDAVAASWSPSAEGAWALAPLDLDLVPGSRVHLTGPNGAGKSTALAVLARHLDPRGGTYSVDGADTTGLDTAAVRELIAMVDDEPHAFAGSVRANLTLARAEATDTEVVEALLAVDLGAWLATLPEGLDTLLGGLSGGERARLSLARALLSSRPVTLLDEPAAHLDEHTAQRALNGMLDAAPDGTTFVLVSHRPVDRTERTGWTENSLDLPTSAEAQRSTTSNSISSAPVATGF